MKNTKINVEENMKIVSEMEKHVKLMEYISTEPAKTVLSVGIKKSVMESAKKVFLEGAEKLKNATDAISNFMEFIENGKEKS